ncbi:ABC transporter substrate-binding protein [uncultured Microbacterium sp.]|uniref:ABC transporter substrate-binding protein n=1 Tax=uncultured Microbacterium sp. TaxID=191216 RepID=UPI0025D11DDA|nr:extracellular solute-binding protein [uncultured Microbacterium sp.]
MTSRVSRIVSIAAVAAAGALMLAGCSSSGGGSDSATLQVQTNMAAGSPQLAALTKMADSFEKANPGVKLNLIPSTNTYEQDLKVMLAAHNAPDIWQTHGWSRDRYSQFLAPLQGESWNKDVNKILDPSMRDSSGNIYALPMVADVTGLLYNADVLKKVGVDPATLTSWDAFDAAAAKIKAAGVTPIAVSGKDNGPAGNLIDWMAPGFYSQDQLASLKKGTFQSDAYKPILDQVQKWAKAGYINPDYSSATSADVSKALGAGQAAFVFSQNTSAQNAFTTSPDANIGFFPIPTQSGTPYLIGGEGIAYGASKTGKNLADAKKFLDFLAQPANQETFAVAAGGVPGLTTAKVDLGKLQPSYDQWVVKAKSPLVPYFDRVYLPNGLWNTLVTTTDSVITGQSTPAAGTDQVGKDFQSLYGQKQ